MVQFSATLYYNVRYPRAL